MPTDARLRELLRCAAATIFQYPALAQERRHGPRGYANARWYKVWLRDEFCFRCVYCLSREQWEPNGSDAFSGEHIESLALSPERVGDYDNLLYSCLLCNACRREAPLPFDPSAVALAMHLYMRADGTIEALTREGRLLCDLCHLNRPPLVQFRRYMQELVDYLVERPDVEAERALQHLLGFPEDLPNLRTRRPPGGNTRLAGIDNCWYERRRRSELPEVY
jgi:hypothetical protein